MFGEYWSDDNSTYSVSTSYHNIQNFIPEHGAICNADGLSPDCGRHVVSRTSRQLDQMIKECFIVLNVSFFGFRACQL
jgi:hypothetical protein